jgi:arabinofuranosyltransferase
MTLALRWGPLAAIAGLLVWHSLRFDFVTDDAYVSFVYTRNLVEHGQLVFNPGDPVEGYTNFLWTVLLAIPMALGIPPELAARVLGTGFAVGTLVVAFRLTERLIGRREGTAAQPWAYLPPLLLAMSSGFACWASGGLETQLFTFLVAVGRDDCAAATSRLRRLSRMGLLLALAAMTRPEGLLVAGAIGLHRLVVNLARDRRLVPSGDELIGVASFALVWAPWFAWRWWYYGWPFPNTYYVKAAGTPASAGYAQQLVDAGWFYVQQWVSQLRLAWAAPLLLAGLVVTRPRTPRFLWVTVAVPLALGYLVYVARVGGDFMGLHRFVMPLFVIAAVLATLGLERLASLIPPARIRRWAAPAAAAGVALAFGVSQARLTQASLHPPPGQLAVRGIDTPAYLIAYTENRAAIGKAMRGCFRDDDFSIVGGAGAQPYFARMRGIDVFGLVSTRIAHEVRPHRPRPGHNKWGPDSLLAEHDPTFVFHCYAIHSTPLTRPLGCGGFWRARGFEQVTMQIPGLDGRREGRDDQPGGAAADRYTFLVRQDRGFACPGLVR